ncbi:hypothetical protein LguiA_005933 [Lonicera macranthoides]
MGDHFVLLVDRLITEYTLEAAIESTKQLHRSDEDEEEMTNFSTHTLDLDSGSLPRKLVECRICHDEDEDSNMEIPCSCCGSLKFAHRRCIQRWCNEKGNTICEICKQQFKPGYTAPPPLFHYGGIPMNFRGNWEISRRELHNSQFIAMVASDRDTSDSDYDEYSGPSTRSLICCCFIAIIFMVLLVLRHTLPIMITGAGDYTITLFMLLMLRTIGILLPICIMVKAFTVIQHRRHRQDPRNFSFSSSDEENELPELQPQPHIIHVR